MSGRPGRVIRAFLSLGLLLGVVVGVPLLLAAMDLVPSVLPSLDQVRTALTTRDDGQLLRVVLGAVAWACWFLFTAATVAEFSALVRARPAPSLPGLRAFQRPAAALVAAVVLGLAAAPTTTATAGADRPPLPTASAPVGATLRETPAPAVRLDATVLAPVALQEDLPRYEVQRRDTLWAIAETHLGDPLRYAEIVQLNAGAVGPDNRIVPGAVLVLPADAVGIDGGAATQAVATTEPVEVTVGPGDTLWGLAEATTGAGENWPVMWDANQGRVEPGGAVFDDPDAIRPGWTLTVPTAREEASEPTVPAPSVPVPSPSAQPSGGGTPSPTMAEPPTSASTSPEMTRPPTAATHPAETATSTLNHADAAGPVAQVLGGGALLAGVSLLALNRYRRRQFRHRRPGRRIAQTPPTLVPVERSLVAAGTADVLWLDRALRSLVQGAAAGTQLPDVVAVSIGSDVLSLVLATRSTNAPEPWTVDAVGLRWSVPREAQLPYDDVQRAHAFSPFPTLVSVGTTPAGEHLLLDLERMGALRIAGDLARGRDLMRFMAAELAHNTWSEMLTVTLVGLGAELAELNPDRLTVSEDGNHAIDELGRQQESRAEALADGRAALDGRLQGEAADAWSPRVLLLGANSDSDSVASLLRGLGHGGGRTGIAVVLVGPEDVPDDGEWRLDIDSGGHGRIAALGVELRVHQLPIAEAAPLAQMLALAAAIDNGPFLQTDGTAEQSEGAEGRNEDPAVARSADPGAATPDSLLPLPESEYLRSAATTARDVRVLAPATDEGRRARAEGADPTLDQDLADWADETCTRPKLTLLGPVKVRAQGRLPERNPRRQFYTEVVAYLATRPGGATSEQYATAIWPDEPDVVGKTKVRQAISVVRAWLGTAPDGSDYLPSGLTAAAGGRYRITDALVDADLFRRLRSRGTARGMEGMTDLSAALGLVSGCPLDVLTHRARTAGGYSWLVDDSFRLDHELAAAVVDVAHVVATFHLGSGEPERAAAAAQVALRAGSFEDVPLLDLVAACDALGNHAEADAYVARILHNHDAEVEEDLPPRTAEILFRRSRS